MSKNNNTISTIQEFTMRSQEMGIFSQMFNDMNMSRPDIFEVIKRWAEEFEEENKDTDWADTENFYYDEVDNFLADKWEDFKNLVDRDGNPYIQDKSWPAGGGLDKRCDYNAEALFAYYAVKTEEGIVDYLANKRGFVPGVQTKDFVEFLKGNTRIIFEDYDPSNGDGLYGYVHTEFIG